jgi:hypothetical protein
MTTIRTTVLLALLALAPAVWGQAEKTEAPKPEPTAHKTAVTKPAPVAKKSRRQQDARHCLDKASNTEVIRCAEAYL